MEDRKEISRRSVLCGLALLALGTTVDTAIAASGVKVLANGKVEVSLAQNPALKKVGGVVRFKDKKGNSLALVRSSNSASGYKALNLSCTHEGSIVTKSGSRWVCPNHGAEFALNGDVKMGPARRNLEALPIKVSASKVVIG